MPRDQCVGGDGQRGQRELLQGPPRTRRPPLIALVFSYEVRDAPAFEQVYGPDGEWAQFFRQGTGYVGTELLRDIELPGRYVVIDRWESAEAYNEFSAGHRDEYMRRVDETAFHYRQELRIGTFEGVWP